MALKQPALAVRAEMTQFWEISRYFKHLASNKCYNIRKIASELKVYLAHIAARGLLVK